MTTLSGPLRPALRSAGPPASVVVLVVAAAWIVTGALAWQWQIGAPAFLGAGTVISTVAAGVLCSLVSRGTGTSAAMRVLALTVTTLAVGLLVAVVGGVFVEAITAHGSTPGGPSFMQACLGTIAEVAIAAAVALPIGVAVAAYTSTSDSRFAAVTGTVLDVMAGTPAVVAGLVVYLLWVVTIGAPFSRVAAGLALGALLLPLVARAGDEALRAVPEELRGAGAALGLAPFATLRRIVVPAARPQVLGVLLVALARVTGEAAPVLLTAGPRMSPVGAIARAHASLASSIYAGAASGVPGLLARAERLAPALLIIVGTLTLAGRAVGRRPAGTEA